MSIRLNWTHREVLHTFPDLHNCWKVDADAQAREELELICDFEMHGVAVTEANDDEMNTPFYEAALQVIRNVIALRDHSQCLEHSCIYVNADLFVAGM